MIKRFFLGLVLFFSISFSFGNTCHLRKGCFSLSSNDKCFACVQYNGSGCYETRRVACQANGYETYTSHAHAVYCTKDVIAGYFPNGNPFFKTEYGGVLTLIDATLDKDTDLSSCTDFVDDDDDPCGNGKDPATCDMDDDDDPCKINPAACVFDDEDPDPDPDPPKYDDDYKPEDPPCQIMVNGKCVFDDPDRKDKICSNGKCKCFEKNENGILKEVPCYDNPFKPGGTSGKRYDYGICTDDGCSCWSEGVAGLFPCNEGEFDRPGNTFGDDSGSGSDSNNDTFNPNSQYDDASYNFDDLDTSTKLPDAKDIKDKTQEVDLSSWGVNDYFNSSGQCPAPNTVSLGMFGSFEVSYEYFCSIARILRTVVIAFAWLTGLLIIAKINK